MCLSPHSSQSDIQPILYARTPVRFEPSTGLHGRMSSGFCSNTCVSGISGTGGRRRLSSKCPRRFCHFDAKNPRRASNVLFVDGAVARVPTAPARRIAGELCPADAEIAIDRQEARGANSMKFSGTAMRPRPLLEDACQIRWPNALPCENAFRILADGRLVVCRPRFAKRRWCLTLIRARHGGAQGASSAPQGPSITVRCQWKGGGHT
mmetsp:Transcript_30173/g.82951  ORF Transcript_30173/g.82951 Transcript_30173/m.82951 type:complete len:208 (+) Transcript_30173:770-1393(+)